MKTWLIIVIVLIIVGSLIFIFSDHINLFFEKRNFNKKVGKKIYQIALDNDYYLISQVALEIDTKIVHFDYILFTNKFIYCVGARYFNGPISGKYDDNQWFKYGKKSEIDHIKNPLILPKVRLEYLKGALKAPDDLFVSLVVINDSCLIDKNNQYPTYNQLINLKDLKFLISKKEKENIADINPSQLQKLVKNIYKRSVKTQQKEKNEIN